MLRRASETESRWGQHMRYVVIGFCVFAAACAGASPTGTDVLRRLAPNSRPDGSRLTTQAEGGSKLPFKGTYEGLETVDRRCRATTSRRDRQRHPSRSIHSDGRLDARGDGRISGPAHGRPPTAMNFPRVLQDAVLWRRPPSHLRKPTPLPAAPADLPTRPAPSQLCRPAVSRCLTTIPPRSTERLTWATDLIGPCVQTRRRGLPLRRVG